MQGLLSVRTFLQKVGSRVTFASQAEYETKFAKELGEAKLLSDVIGMIARSVFAFVAFAVVYKLSTTHTGFWWGVFFATSLLFGAGSFWMIIHLARLQFFWTMKDSSPMMRNRYWRWLAGVLALVISGGMVLALFVAVAELMKLSTSFQ